uniref:P-type ATPase n=1 Tax=Rhodoblastus sp. TaxID=1962975 RepID=UPI003F98B2A1
MELAIRHFMRGRVRLAAHKLCADRTLAEQALAFIRAQSGVSSARINYHCASIVVTFDPAMEPTLRLLIGRLRLMTHDDLRLLLAMAPTEAPGHPAPELLAEEQQKKRIPLVLPSLSLGMALTGNPLMLTLNMPLMLWNAYPIAFRAWRVWRRESRLNIDFLDTLAIAASRTHHNQVAGGLVVWLIKLGDWIRDLTAAGSKRAIGELLEFENKRAWVFRDDEIVSVLARELQVEDRVIVYPGEMIPVDGEILEGSALIDQKTITGEGLPVNRGAGEAAFAATVLREGQLTIRATRVGADTTAGQIVRLIDSAPVGDTRMQNHAEKLADRLVLPTLGLASATAALTLD